MGAINENALSKFIGILEVAPYATPSSLVRIASVRGLVANYDNESKKVEVKADDTGTVFKGFQPEAKIEGSFLENVNRDLMSLLLGGNPSDTAGSIVNNHSQVIAAGWAYNKFIPFDKANGNGTVPTIDSVTGSVDGALVSETDYFLGRNDSGDWGIFVKDSSTVTTLAQTITVQFDYTPNASENITFPLTFTESPRLYVKITAEDETGKERVIILDDATFEGTYGIEFLDIGEAGDLKGTTFVFMGNKGSNLIMQNEIL